MRKLMNAFIILLGVSFAGVLDPINVKQKNNYFVPFSDIQITNIALAGNPAVIAVNKRAKIGLSGTINTSKESFSSNILDTDQFLESGGGVNYYEDKTDYKSNKYEHLNFYFVSNYSDNWFEISYDVENNNRKVEYENLGIRNIYGTPSIRRIEATDHTNEQIETIALTWAREFKWFTSGLRIALNKRSVERKYVYTDIYETIPNPYYDIGDREYQNTNVNPYWSVALGLAKDIANNQKVLLAHNFGSEKNETLTSREVDSSGDIKYYYSFGDYGYRTPDTTALGYVYTVNENLELAGSFTRVWGQEYTHIQEQFTEYESSIKEKREPYDIYGLVISWQVIDNILELQGYGHYANNAGAGVTDMGWYKADTQAVNRTQIGGSIIFSPYENHNIALSFMRSVEEALPIDDSYYHLIWEYTTGELAYSYKF